MHKVISISSRKYGFKITYNETFFDASSSLLSALVDTSIFKFSPSEIGICSVAARKKKWKINIQFQDF